MPGPEDLLLGKIAIQMGLITSVQLEELLKLSDRFNKSISVVLLEKKVATTKDMQRLIELRRVGIDSDAPQPASRKDQIIIARHLAREGAITAEYADECLRQLALEGDKQKIEDVLVDRGVIPPEKAERLRGLRQKRSMHCPRCALNFLVRSASGRKDVECPRCKGPLQDLGPKTEASNAPVEFKTSMMKTIDPDRAPAQTPPGSASGRKIHCQCVICDALFDTELDSSERVKCPQCGSSFRPRV
ncbi:MAG: hypothetical protein HYY16_08615 [Planctomycetes bacterium]|nr:hypothetical protein [Planctomycetota bacterium]